MKKTEPKVHRSSSQLTKYMQCSELYRLSYVDKPDLPVQPAAWLAQGTAYHETVRIWEESGRSELMDVDAVYIRIYNEEIKKMKAQQPNLNLWLRAFSKTTEKDIDERLTRGILQIRDYVSHALSNPFDIKELDEWTLGIEVPFEVTLGGIVVKGAIDRIDQLNTGVRVVDLKTGNRESANIQLGIYKVAVEKIFGWPVKEAGFFYAKDSKLISLTGRDLERYSEAYVTDLLLALNRGVNNQVFIPNPGSQCTMCPVKKFCREWN